MPAMPLRKPPLSGIRVIELARVLAELDRREGLSGLAEKAARPRD